MGRGEHTGVPARERQRWLIEQTRALVLAQGAKPLLRAPLLEPTPKFFPDGWDRDLPGARAITRRLLDFAGLKDLELNVEAFVNELPPDIDGELRHVAGFFRGIEGGVCQFGINVPALDDPEYLAGVMAHEVAHAFRHHHRLQIPDRDTEEELTDLTTVYLGSGTLLTNLADRVVEERTPQIVSVRRSSGGYLAVEELAFLLALQLRARGAGHAELERVEQFLGSSQVYCLRHALDALDDQGLDELSLRGELGVVGVVEPGKWSAPAPTTVAGAGYNQPWGRTVYCARPSRALAGTGAGLAVGFVLSLLMLRGKVDGASLALGLGPLLGAALGRRGPIGRCSNPDCGVPLPTDATECPGCKGHVLGTLDSPPSRFAVGLPNRKRVKRLIGYQTATYASWGAWLGGCLWLSSFSFGASVAWVWLVALSAALGAVLGCRKRRDTCGEHRCDAVLEPFVRVCPRCLCEIWGEARSRVELL